LLWRGVLALKKGACLHKRDRGLRDNPASEKGVVFGLEQGVFAVENRVEQRQTRLPAPIHLDLFFALGLTPPAPSG